MPALILIKKQTMNFKTTRFQLVEIPVPDTAISVGGRIMINDQPQLRTQTGQTIVIQALESYYDDLVPKTPTIRDVVPLANFESSFLVLNVFGYETLQSIPLTELSRINLRSSSQVGVNIGELFRINDLYRVDWSKSYIQCTTAISANSGLSFLLGVHYYVIPDDTIETAPLPSPIRVL